MNQVALMGRLTADPETRTNASTGNSVVKFNLAVDRKYAKEQKKTDFLPVSCFGKTAEAAEKYLRKGVKICLEGRIQDNEWTDKEGKKRHDVIIVMDGFYFCEAKKTEEEKPKSDGMFVEIEETGEELPFQF